MIADFFSDYYLQLKALHVIFVIFWMCGMMYLPRLYAYHVAAVPGSELDLTLQTMERRLYRGVMLTSMLAALLFGILLIVTLGFKNLGHWFHIKLFFVFFMFGLHGLFGKYRKDFVKGANKHSARFYKILNELPAILVVAIVFLAIVKP